MRRFCYIEPDEYGRPINIVVTEKYILDNYMPYWNSEMSRLERDSLITEENCIQDFLTLHWATEIK